MKKRKNIIDISSEDKKKEVYNLFLSFKSKNQAHIYFNISDNKNGSEYLEYIAKMVGFDLTSYKKSKKCLECGKEIISKTAKKFCSKSCAVSFNNKHRSKDVYKKIASKLKKDKNISHSVKKDTKEKYRKCIYCGKEFKCNDKKIYCSFKCSSEHKHKIAYQDFLDNNEKYCRGNYTPKTFKSEFLKEQNGVCAICNSKPIHNGKPLVFILDHIDGDASNNKRENLRMICPNCDSQLETYKSKNKNSTRRNYWKDKIIRDIQGNIQQN